LQRKKEKLADLQARRDEARRARPSVIPHPTLVAKGISDLADFVESGDPAKVGPILRWVLVPFRMVPAGESYILRGALDLSGPLRVCDDDSNGGVI
jgi:hypothetical protein